MSDEKFEVIVVGAGVAGCAAACYLAREGMEVILVERGEQPGSKNLSGGILYGSVLQELFPSYWEEAPLERHIYSHITTFLTGDSSFSIDFKNRAFGQPPYNGFSVLRSHFDRWFAEKAEEAGAMLVPGIKVDGLLKDGDRIAGITAGGEEMLADVVVAADGANSFLAQQAGLRGPIRNKDIAVGVKAVIGLTEDIVAERFNLQGNGGTAIALVGEVTHGLAGGGFLYTNLDSLSVGVVVRLDDLVGAGLQSSQLLDDFLVHPLVSPYVKDGRLLEYGAHLVPEGGLAMMPQLAADGMLVVGDAAGFTINNGLVVRGMDLAIGSGIAAAKAIIDAQKQGNYRTSSLNAYTTYLQQSYVMKDMETYSTAPRFMETDRLYSAYPEFVTRMMTELFCFDTTPKSHILPAVFKSMKASGIGWRSILRDGWKGVRSL